MADPLVFQHVHVRELLEFADRKARTRQPGEVLPISLTRARAWTQNPYAVPDDVALVVALQGGRVVGYSGILPGRLRVDGQVGKVCWRSTFYVSPEVRRQKVGTELHRQVWSLGVDVVGTGASEEAEAVYRRLGYLEARPVRHYSLDILRANLLALPLRMLRRFLWKRGRSSQALDRAIQWGNRGARRLVLARLRDALGAGLSAYTTVVTPELPDFEAVKDRRQAVRFDRGRPWLSWMLEHPWVTTDPEQDTPGYYFDDLRQHFEYRLLEVRTLGRTSPKGFVILWRTAREGRRDLHVLDFHFHDPQDVRLLAHLAVDQALLFAADRIHLPEYSQPQIAGCRLGRWLFVERSRPVFVRPASSDSLLARNLDRLVTEYADGDCGFA